MNMECIHCFNQHPKYHAETDTYCCDLCHHFWLGPRARAAWRASLEAIVSFWGLSLPVAHWAEISGIDAGVLACRLEKGWSVERALTERSWCEDDDNDLDDGGG